MRKRIAGPQLDVFQEAIIKAQKEMRGSGTLTSQRIWREASIILLTELVYGVTRIADALEALEDRTDAH